MKTKIIIMAMFFSSLTYSAFAQFQNGKENNGKLQIGVLLNTVEPIQSEGVYDFNQRFLRGGYRKDKSYSTGLNFSYKIKDNFCLRLSTKLTNYNIEESQDTREYTPFTSSQYDINDFKAKSSVINISPGILWNFIYKIINPYGGFQLEYKKYNKVIINHLDAYYDLSNNFLPSASASEKIKQGGGYSIGAGAFIGFSVKTYKAFSIGAEFSSAFSYYKLGGMVENIVANPMSNPSFTIMGPDTNEGFKISTISSSINISINF